MGRFLPALHRSAVAQGTGTPARAEYARVYESGVSSRAHRKVPHSSAEPAHVPIDQHAGALASGSSRVRFSGGPVGAQPGAEVDDAAQTEGGRAPALGRAGDVLRPSDGRCPADAFQPPL